MIRYVQKPVETIGCCSARRKNLPAVMATVPPGEKIHGELRQAGRPLQKSAEVSGISSARRKNREKQGNIVFPTPNSCFFSWRQRRIPKISKKQGKTVFPKAFLVIFIKVDGPPP